MSEIAERLWAEYEGFCKRDLAEHAIVDARFAENPLVTGAPRIRFYAGYPLHVEKGVCVGTLCLLDTRPRELTTREHQLLRDLGQLVAQELKGGWALTGRNPAGVDVLRT